MKKLENYTKKSGNILSEAHQITKQRNPYFRFRLTRKYNIIIKSKSPVATTGDKIKKSARRESNPRPPPWQGGAPPLSHSRIVLCKLSAALTRTSSILLHVPGNVNSFLKFFYIFLLILFFCVPLFALWLNTFLSALTVFTIATVNAAVCTVSTRT